MTRKISKVTPEQQGFFNKDNVVFDTCILIDFLNGIEQAKIELTKYKKSRISIITWAEILVGASSEQEETELVHFLQKFVIINLEKNIALAASRIKRELRIKLPDALILASAQETGATLLTRNTKDFSNISHVKIPYTI